MTESAILLFNDFYDRGALKITPHAAIRRAMASESDRAPQKRSPGKGLLNNIQHGFRIGWSCLSALLNVFDNLMNMIDSSTTVDMIYLDFSKAFDMVDHGIVLHKLRDLGITGNLGVWFHQFLSDRTNLSDCQVELARTVQF